MVRVAGGRVRGLGGSQGGARRGGQVWEGEGERLGP